MSVAVETLLGRLHGMLAAVVAASEELALGDYEQAAAILADLEAHLAALVEGGTS